MLNRLLSWLAPPRATLRITRRGNPVATLEVEVAANAWRRARGLMGRKDIAPAGGMLFVYPWPRIVRIWMARTPLPLDVLFIDQRRRVTKIVPDLKPSAGSWTCSDTAVNWVLEVPAGTAEGAGIAVGNSVAIAMDRAADPESGHAEARPVGGFHS